MVPPTRKTTPRGIITTSPHERWHDFHSESQAPMLGTMSPTHHHQIKASRRHMIYHIDLARASSACKLGNTPRPCQPGTTSNYHPVMEPPCIQLQNLPSTKHPRGLQPQKQPASKALDLSWEPAISGRPRWMAPPDITPADPGRTTHSSMPMIAHNTHGRALKYLRCYQNAHQKPSYYFRLAKSISAKPRRHRKGMICLIERTYDTPKLPG